MRRADVVAVSGEGSQSTDQEVRLLDIVPPDQPLRDEGNDDCVASEYAVVMRFEFTGKRRLSRTHTVAAGLFEGCPKFLDQLDLLRS